MAPLARWAVVGSVVAGLAAGGHSVLGAAARARTASPCARVAGVATWSPNGRQIAYVGSGAPRLHAICVADATGKHARPLRYAVCRQPCRLDLIDSPTQLDWVRPKLLLYGDDFRIFTVRLGKLPEPLGNGRSFASFAVDAKGDRIAAGIAPCGTCHGPITVLSVPEGNVVGMIGGAKSDNFSPSLSPDGKRVVFVDTTPTAYQVSTASVDGSHLQLLAHCGDDPLWSPTGGTIACVGTGARSSELLLVSPGGASSTLVPRGVVNPHVLGWSPNGKRIAFLSGRCGCKLDLVDVRTGKVRQLLGGAGGASVAWSPDSRRLLVTEPVPRTNCARLWRVSAGGAKPRRLRSCS
jgi:WD40-like Beta Propeller Repeat